MASRIPNDIITQVVITCRPIIFFLRIPLEQCWFLFYSLNIGMLTMRIYALYERSRKVLALYIVISIVNLAVGCVSLNRRENQCPV